MGLLDSLYAGVGQGAAAGMANYTKTSQELADEQRKQQLFQMQSQQHQYEQASKNVGLLQSLMQGDLRAGRNDLAAGRVGDLRGSYETMLGHKINMPDVVGSPVGGTPAVPAQTLAAQGPTPTGDALAPVNIPGKPAVAPHNDFGNAQSYNTLASYAGYVPATPKIETAAPGSLLYHYDTKQGKVVMDGQAPNKPGANYIRTPAGLYDPIAGQMVGGTGPAPKAGPGMQHVAVPQADGTVKYYVFNPQSGTYSDAPAVVGGKPATGKPDPNWVGYKAVAPYDDLIESAASTFGVPANILRAQLYKESGGNPNARGAAGEYGLMQLMPETVRDLGLKNPLDPAENIFGGAKWLAMKIQQQGGDVRRGVRAYNGAGPQAEAYATDIFGTVNRFENRSVAPPAKPKADSYQTVNGHRVLVDGQGNVKKDLGKAGKPGMIDAADSDNQDAVGQAIVNALKNKGK